MIELKNCQKVYPNGNIGIKEVNIKLPNDGLVGVYGKSGSGKSTLLNCLGGLDKFTSGIVLLNGEEILDLNKYSTFIFQEYKLIEEMTVVDNLLIACPNEDEDRVDNMLKKFDLYSHKNAKVNAISGGQRQRVEIIRALLQDVDIILCDEPIANLDEENKILILDLLKEFSQEKLILIVSHDKELIQKYTNGFLIIDEGQVIESHIESTSSKSFTPKMISPKSLSFKHSFYLAMNNIKKNKLKSIMTFVFSFLSLTMLTILFTVLSMNLSQLFYNSFHEKEVTYFTLKPFDDEKKYPSLDNITDADIEKMKPEIVSYENLDFVFEFNQETNLVRTIWKLTEYNTSYHLEENEIYINEKLAGILGNSTDEVVGKEINVGVSMLTIKGIIPNTEEESVFLMNENTFNHVKGNYLRNNYILLSFGENSNQGVDVYNPYMSEDKLNYNLGREPQTKDEIALPQRILENYNLTMENAIGAKVTLNIKTEDVNPIEFTIVGITNNHLVVSKEEFPTFISTYGLGRVEAGSKGMIIFNYSEKLIHQAINLNLCPVHALTNDVLFIYHMLNGFTLVLSVLAGIFAVIAIFTILNSTNTSLIKNKKNIGVFITFKIKNLSILNSYWIENLIIGLGSVLLTCIFYPIILFIINSMINKEWNLNISFLRIKFWIIIVTILFSMLVTVLGLIIPFKKILRKQPIDILYDR